MTLVSLPLSLILLLVASSPIFAQQIQQITPGTEIPIPLATESLDISVASCTSNAQFIVTNSSNSETQSISVKDGIGVLTGSFPNGATLRVDGVSGTGQVGELGISSTSNGPVHQLQVYLPLLGDTTSNQAIIFSPPFTAPNYTAPSYPNYTLPSPPTTLTIPQDVQSQKPSYSLIVTKGGTGCPWNVTSSANVIDESVWLRDAREGYRVKWVVGGLEPSSNYTVFVVDANRRRVSGPINFLTKSAAFSCPLVTGLPFCPGANYAVPFSASGVSSSSILNASNLPQEAIQPLLSNIGNFTVSLTASVACGRDDYSPLKGCHDCQREYTRWICAMWFPRCGEAPIHGSSTSAIPGAGAGTGAQSNIFKRAFKVLQTSFVSSTPDDEATYPPPPALRIISSTSDSPSSKAVLNPLLPTLTPPFTVLLPCLATCWSVDRACPVKLGFVCPKKEFGAAWRYGVDYVGVEGSELVNTLDDTSTVSAKMADTLGGQAGIGAGQDRWGNVWCASG